MIRLKELLSANDRISDKLRIHVSKEPITSLVPKEPIRGDKPISKPNGIWYGFGRSWLDYVAGHPHINHLQYQGTFIYLVKIKDQNKILRLKTRGDIDKFNEKYYTKPGINWQAVAQSWSGIEINPFIPNLHRDGGKYSWYQTWDVASGCVWDVSAIQLKLIYPKQQSVVKENEDEDDNEQEGVDLDRLHSSDWYLDEVAEKMGYPVDFSKAFWSRPTPLWHCTRPENLEVIQKDGIKAKNDARGISNRSVGNAVFTVREDLEIPFFKRYYGNLVFQINTKQMKLDGYMPEATMEPDWDRANKIAYVLNKLGHEAEASRFVDSSDQNTEGTVILYGDIPAKYLSIYEND